MWSSSSWCKKNIPWSSTTHHLSCWMWTSTTWMPTTWHRNQRETLQRIARREEVLFHATCPLRCTKSVQLGGVIHDLSNFAILWILFVGCSFGLRWNPSNSIFEVLRIIYLHCSPHLRVGFLFFVANPPCPRRLLRLLSSMLHRILIIASSHHTWSSHQPHLHLTSISYIQIQSPREFPL